MGRKIVLILLLALIAEQGLSMESSQIERQASSTSAGNIAEFNQSTSQVESNLNTIHPLSSSDAGLSLDDVEDSMFDPLQADPDCLSDNNNNNKESATCWTPPDSTIDERVVVIDATCSYGGSDPDGGPVSQQCLVDESSTTAIRYVVDQHWGSDPHILRMRDELRQTGSGESIKKKSQKGYSNNTTPNSSHQFNSKRENRRPPIFLVPGLASTRLVAWRFKPCRHHPLLSDIKIQDYVWLNLHLIMQMSTIDVSCMSECLRLGWNQSDTDDLQTGCKLRPDEGLDAISSLSPGGIGSQLFVGGTNTVYAWLIQWLADNLGYDVSNIIGLPNDWRLSPDKMEQRDGFLTQIRRRIEAAVQTNGEAGIVVAHSMGNTIFRYFLAWLLAVLQDEAYDRYVKVTRRRKHVVPKTPIEEEIPPHTPGWMGGVVGNVRAEDWRSLAALLESNSTSKHPSFWALAKIEGHQNWLEWIETHIWTYVGLSAPLLGAVNPLRAVISGENMGLPVTDAAARVMELTFGSTHTVNPVSTKEGFCDQRDVVIWDDETETGAAQKKIDNKLACLDDIEVEIDSYKNETHDPWSNFPALKSLMLDRVDWNTKVPMIRIVRENCDPKEKSPCASNSTIELGPRDVETGNIFTVFNDIWREEESPLIVKREQLRESFWDTNVQNILNNTWERPIIKHVIMAYGVDIPTEAAYSYRKKEIKNQASKEFDGIPELQTAYWETAGGKLETERMTAPRGNIADILLMKKKPKRDPWQDGPLSHSGDGSVPYISLVWAQTWLLHAARAMRHESAESDQSNPLDDIRISHRPKGAMEWRDGPPPKDRVKIVPQKKDGDCSSDTGTAHPHGTKYKPEMIRYYSSGTSRRIQMNYTTTVIEAIGVEHKETTRNYDILAAVFTDVLKFMHDDLSIV